MTAIYGKTITITPQTVDNFGDRTSGTPTTVPGCVVYETPGTETVGPQDTLVYTVSVLAPPGTVVSSTDRVTLDGVTFEVVAQPIEWTSPYTGLTYGVQVVLRHVEG